MIAALLAIAAVAAPPWPMLGGDARHAGVAPPPAPTLAAPAWIASVDAEGAAIVFADRAGVVASETRVVAVGRSDGADRVYAVDRTSGAVLWSAPVGAPVFDSWSTPAIDPVGRCVVVASGSSLTAHALLDGGPAWSTPLPRPIVNASPIVTTDLGARDRLFITDYDGFGDQGTLHCVNVDAFDAAANPHEPGAIVWSRPLAAATSGNTPAYADGWVYVADADGRIARYAATASTAPSPDWSTAPAAGQGFFGGVTLTSAGDAVLAASYAFSGGQLAARLVKLDAATGAVLWTTPCNRTSAMPIALPDGRIVVSAGLDGFGSATSVQLFADLGPEATLLWASALATWDDDGDGALEPGEYDVRGGWTHHPIAVADAAGAKLVVGVPAAGGGLFGAYDRLSVVDLEVAPGDAGFVVSSTAGGGSTPAIAGASVYAVGLVGLHAYGPAPSPLDVDGDGDGTIEDLYAWEAALGGRDVDRDLDVDADDRAALRAGLRAGELEDVRR